jgi:hypothetical protein
MGGDLKCLSQKGEKRAGGVTHWQSTKHSEHKALSSKLSTAPQKRRKNSLNKHKKLINQKITHSVIDLLS